MQHARCLYLGTEQPWPLTAISTSFVCVALHSSAKPQLLQLGSRHTQKDNHTILADEHDDAVDFASYLEHIVPKHYEDKNLVIDLLKYEALTLEELVKFIKLSNYQRGGKKSYVIVNTGIDYDLIPDEMMVVPTLQEAADIIEMEEIERDLGF